jgi:type III pantothenate kinase
MILTIDVGNTNIAFGIHTGERWLDHWRLHTDPEQTADEYLVLFHNLLGVAGHELESIQRIVVSSVVPALTPAIIQVAGRLSPSVAPLVVHHRLVTGLNPDAEIPGELGNDLLANAVAVYHRYRAAAIVVDFGTALTFTAISRDGRILGVSIAPGIRSAMRALAGNTAQLPTVELIPPPDALPRTTVHAIQSGIVFGYVGLVGEILKRMSGEMGVTPVIVATGGLSEQFAPIAGVFDAVDQWLTLDGLRLLAGFNPAVAG